MEEAKKRIADLVERFRDFNNPTEKEKHDQMVALMEQMLDLNKNSNPPKSPRTRNSSNARSRSPTARSTGWFMSFMG